MFKTNRSISIQYKFMMFFIIVAAVLSITVGFLFLRSSNTTINSAKEEQLSTLSQETANKIERFLFERYGDIQVMAKLPLLKNQVANTGLQAANTALQIANTGLIEDYLKSVREAYKTYDYIFIVDKDANIGAFSGEIGQDINWKAGLAKVLSGQIYISGFIKNDIDKTYKVYFEAPIYGDQGNIIGAVVERMNFDSISQIVENVRIGQTGKAYLISIKEGDLKFDDALRIALKENIADKSAGVYYGKKDNKDIILAYTKIKVIGMPENPWYLVVEEPAKEAFQASYNFRNYLILVLIISITITFILAYFMSKLIASPIQRLVQETRNIAETGITETIKVEGNDEVSSLAESFNLLMGNMRDVSAGLAHEIKNPLASIKGYAQYVGSEMTESDPLAGDMKIIVTEVDRLNNILDRFLSFARLRAPVLKSSDLNAIIERIINLYLNEKLTNENDFARERIKVSRNFGDIPHIMIDQEQIGQVISNILINAFQAMPEGGHLEVSTRKQANANYIEVIIKDTGKGIPAEDRDKIFEPFYTTKDKGTGLGLAISLRIIENHKGVITVCSKPDQGTIFILKLPIRKDEL